jgi:hypothetical protein
MDKKRNEECKGLAGANEEHLLLSAVRVAEFLGLAWYIPFASPAKASPIASGPSRKASRLRIFWPLSIASTRF